MKTYFKLVLVALFTVLYFNAFGQDQQKFKPKELFKSEDLIITQIAKNSFIHTSYLQTNDFGKVACNGLIINANQEVIIYDTPTNNKGAELLITWVNQTLKAKIKAIIPTHFHDDCLGGLQSFHQHLIPSYAYFKTIALAKENNFTIPQNSFKNAINLKIGNTYTTIKYFGEGHTKDNVVGYFPNDEILFGGCLIKELSASKGYLGDANVSTWSATVEKVKKAYPKVKIIVPGHGNYGNQQLLDYTINLFKVQ